ncbi:MAG: tetratricopeptide repeat protein, partial [Gemmataceae bacterium]|nr:tetratricopeptide repeat protein [Gemmataceae bacterium]
ATARDTRDALHALRIDLTVPGDPEARTRGIADATARLDRVGFAGNSDWVGKSKLDRLPPALRAEAVADVGEVAALLARARWEGAKDLDPAARAALAGELSTLAGRAAGCFADGSVPTALAALRGELAAAAGREPPAPPAGAPDTSARGLFLDGAAAMNRRDTKTAVPLFERATAADPGHAAAQFCLAVCRHRLGQLDRALERYEVAAALLPGDPRPFFRRGTIYGVQGRFADAEAEFTKVLDRDPGLVDAYRNRAVARADQKKYPEAHQDLSDALDRGAPRLQVLLTRSAVREAMGDRTGAAADRRAVEEAGPATELDYLARGHARLAADPNGALADFRAAERLNPRSIAGLHNQITVLSEHLGDDAGALEVATRALELDPESGMLRALKALLLARLGLRTDAHREADRARILPNDSNALYQLARVYAITAATHPTDAATAADYLRRAVRGGFRDVGRLTSDRAFGSIRDDGMAEVVRTLKMLTQ